MDLSLISFMSLPLYFLLSFFVFFFATTKMRRSSNGHGRLPPGPPGLPLVGNIFQLGFSPHRSLAALSKTYGPIMTLKLGRLATMVICSPEAAKEALKTHDQVMSSRSYNDPVRALDHHTNGVVWIPPSARWRFMRRTLAKYLLSPQNLDAIQSLRMRKVEELVCLVNQCCERGEVIDFARAFFVTAFNIISNALFSVDLATYNSNSPSHEFHDTMFHLMEVSGKPNAADFFPCLRFLDLEGNRKEAGLCTGRIFRVIQEFIDDRMAKRMSQTEIESKQASSIDMLDSLLDLTLESKEEFTINDIKHLLLDIFVAGTDTNSSTMEWVMAELMHNPEKMNKAQTEIRQVIGDNGVVQESDIAKLPYFEAVVKETLRLHPAVPLIPRRSESDVQILGFLVPKNTSVLINAWAIGRDSSAWENPMKFEPERFLSREYDVRGKNFEMLPFGAGRRMCPGISMAFKTMSSMLVSLLYSFDWKLQNGVAPESMDMSEAFGLTLPKAKPLCAVPIKKPTIV